MKKTFKLTSVIIAILLAFTFIADAQDASIAVHYPRSERNDTLDLYLVPPDGPCSASLLYNYNKITAGCEEGGWFRFHIPSKQLPTISLIILSRRATINEMAGGDQNKQHVADILEFYPMDKGDQVTVNIQERGKISYSRSSLHNFNLTFSGNSALKFIIRRAMDTIAYYTPLDEPLKIHAYTNSNSSNNNITRSLALLGKYKQDLDPLVFDELKAHAVYANKETEALISRHKNAKEFTSWTTSEKEQYIADFQRYFDPKQYDLSPNMLLRSNDFADAEMVKQVLFTNLRYGENYLAHLHEALAADLNGQLREKQLIAFLSTNRLGIAEDTIYRQIGEFIKSPRYKADLNRLAVRRPGRTAYDFALPDKTGKIIRMSDFKNKVVFIDFWFTGCENCTNFYQHTLSQIEEKYKNDPDVVFISVSIDRSKTLWLNSINSEKYTSPRALNLYTEGKGTQNDVIQYYQIMGYPQPMLVGKDQKLRATSSSFRSEEDIVNGIEQLKKEN